jgi:hypothetical protein
MPRSAAALWYNLQVLVSRPVLLRYTEAEGPPLPRCARPGVGHADKPADALRSAQPAMHRGIHVFLHILVKIMTKAYNILYEGIKESSQRHAYGSCMMHAASEWAEAAGIHGQPAMSVKTFATPYSSKVCF